MIYDVDYFIKKFSAIPENKWTTQFYNIVIDGEKVSSCALGHCGASDDFLDMGNEADALWSIVMENTKLSTHKINDGDCRQYQQPTPKQRILAALYDIKAKQQPIYKDATEELIQNINIGDTSDQPVKENNLHPIFQQILKPFMP